MPTLLLTNYAKLITATQLPAFFPSKHWLCIMFDNLSDKLQRVFKNMRGEGKLTPANMEEALREIRVALLEADVHFKVVKQFIEDVKVKAMGEDVLTALSPSQQVIKIVRDELTKMLGTHQSRLRFANEPPTVMLIVGLQGSGKTTSTAKLARFLTKEGNKPQLVSVDVYRPAARHQLSILAKQINAPIYEGTPEETKPLDLAKGARREAMQTGRDVILVDTAGRQHIDEQLMQELSELKEALNPTEILFVADAMTGQDAVKSADEFHKRLGITGVILTKMDGDARGGAALSIRSITGQPLKFVGVGEKSDALEPFHPDRVAQRILGMGDVLSLIDKVQQTIDLKDRRKDAGQTARRRFHPRRLQRSDQASAQTGLPQRAARNDAANRPAQRTEERQTRRIGRRFEQNCLHYRFHDPERTPKPHDYQWFPPSPHRQRQRNLGARCKQFAETIRASA
jgi:signal recognition particle GTPase